MESTYLLHDYVVILLCGYHRTQGSSECTQEVLHGKSKEAERFLRLKNTISWEWHGWKSQEHINLGLGIKMGCFTSSPAFGSRWLPVLPLSKKFIGICFFFPHELSPSDCFFLRFLCCLDMRVTNIEKSIHLWLAILMSTSHFFFKAAVVSF